MTSKLSREHLRDLARCRKAVVCQSGPFKHRKIWVSPDRVTLVFTVNGQTGRYIGGQWDAVS